MTVTGYHGTTLARANEILRNGFRVSDKPWEWLGIGVYFWQDAPHRAYEWGRDWSRLWRRRGEIVVVAAEVELGNCLDLLDTFWSRRLDLARDRFYELQAATGKIYENKPDGRHFQDCAFFNFFVELARQEGMLIETVRAAVAEGEPLFLGSPVHNKSHVEIAVRQRSLIRNTRIVPMEGDLLDVERGHEER